MSKDVGVVFGWLWCVLAGATALTALTSGHVAAAAAAAISAAAGYPPLWKAKEDRPPVLTGKHRAIVAIGALFLSSLLSAISDGSFWGSDKQTTKQAIAAKPEPVDPLAKLDAKLSKDAVLLMDAVNYPKMLAKLGKARFDEANDLTRWAALAAAESEQCPKVETIGVSDKTTRKALHWYVDCSNSERFMIDETQATAMRAKFDPNAAPDDRKTAQQAAIAKPKSARWEKFDQAMAMTACDLLTQNAMLVPRSFDTAWGVDVYKDDDTGIVVIERDYKSENAFSQKINGRYKCTLDGDANAVKGLSIRDVDGWKKLI